MNTVFAVVPATVPNVYESEENPFHRKDLTS